MCRKGRLRSRGLWKSAGLVLLLLVIITACGKETTPETGSDAQSVEALFQQGNAYIQQGDLEKAAAAFEAALKRQPHHLGSLSNLGVVYYQQGRLEEAAAKFEAGLRVAPNDAQLHYLLGATRLQQNRLEEAEKSFLRARDLQPDLPEVYYGLGALYRLQGKTQEAIEAFEHFLEVGPAQDPQAEAEARRELRELRGY